MITLNMIVGHVFPNGVPQGPVTQEDHSVEGFLVGGADLSKSWQEGFDNNANTQIPALKERIEKLEGWMTDIKTGKRLTFDAKQGVGIEVNVNGTVKGIIEKDDFAKAFLSIWLGTAPPNPGLKAGLLGGACG